jgi:hypothetical protein
LNATVDVAFSHQVTTNFSASSITITELPPGLEATAAGLISGTPTQGGVYQLNVSALASDNEVVQATLMLTIDGGIGAPEFLDSQLSATGPVNASFSYLPAIRGATQITVALASGELPPGLTLNSSGLISGTPTSTGTYVASLTASNSVGANTAPLVIVIGPADGSPSIARPGGSPPAITVKVGEPVDFTVVAAGANNTSQIVGSLPKGLSFDGTTISGAPLEIGTFAVEILVFNAETKMQDTTTLTITVIGSEDEDVTAVFSFTDSLKQNLKNDELSAEGRYSFVISAQLPNADFSEASTLSLKIQRTVRAALGDMIVEVTTINLPLASADIFKGGESAVFYETVKDGNGKEVKVGTVTINYSKGVLTVKGMRRGSTLRGGASTLAINHLLNAGEISLNPPKDIARNDFSAVLTLGSTSNTKSVSFDLSVSGKKPKVNGENSQGQPLVTALSVKGGQIKKTAKPKPSVRFSGSYYSVDESSTTATITVKLSVPATKPITVNYSTSNGTASAGSDYTSASGSVTFAKGDSSKTFTVPITNDVRDETNETINLSLSGPSGGATLGSPSTATIAIIDND